MSEPIQPGSIIGDRYEILQPLGSGGFATIYEARHLHMQRHVAIKILNLVLDKTDAPEFEERFVMEAKAASQIEHSNVVTIYDFGFTGEGRQPFMAMQLLEGSNLYQELSAQGPMDPKRAVQLFKPCLDGLGEAHEYGIIHKDLKPSNLFLKGSKTRETLCILDFGLACIVDQDVSRLTSSGNLLGTPKYLAPEYIEDQTATPALDVYQMGLIFVEMLTGVSVIQADQVYACIMAHCRGALMIPKVLAESPLGSFLAKSMAFDHTARYQDAREMLLALEEIDVSAIPRLAPDPELCLISSLKLSKPLALDEKPSVTTAAPAAVVPDKTQNLYRVEDNAVSPPVDVSSEPPVVRPSVDVPSGDNSDGEDESEAIVVVTPPVIVPESKWPALVLGLVVVVVLVGTAAFIMQEPAKKDLLETVSKTSSADTIVPTVEKETQATADVGLARVDDVALEEADAETAVHANAADASAEPDIVVPTKTTGGARKTPNTRVRKINKAPNVQKKPEKTPTKPPETKPTETKTTPMKVVP